MALAEQAYRLTGRFPKEEVYGMRSQIRRAAMSIAANIAEGHGRENSGVFIQFLRVSQGSLKETHLMLVERVKLAKMEEVAPLLDACDELGKMVRSLIRSIQHRHVDV